jgi:hypothetical protein
MSHQYTVEWPDAPAARGVICGNTESGRPGANRGKRAGWGHTGHMNRYSRPVWVFGYFE